MKLIYYNKQDNIPTVKDDPRHMYEWEAIYNTGEVFKQFNEDGTENAIGDLNFKQIKQINLYPNLYAIDDTNTKEGQENTKFIANAIPSLPRVTVYAKSSEDERLIKFWQRTVNMETQKIHKHREVIGIQKTVKGVNVKFFVLIDTNGDITVSSTDDVE